MDASPHRQQRRAAWFAFGLAASCYLVAMFHRMSLGIASLDAEARFHIGAGAVAALSVVGLTGYLLGQVPAGLLADRIGPRRTLTLGLLLMAVGELLFATAHSLALILVGRALIGLGDACIFLNVLRIAAHWFPRERFAPLTSLTAALGAAGQLITTSPLNAALDGPGWTATFATGAGATALLAVLIFTALKDRPRGQEAPPRHGHLPIVQSVKTAWHRPQTRDGFWLHLTAMAPFVVLTGLWGAPTLVDAHGWTRGQASAALLAAVAATGVAAPLLGLAARRHPGHRHAIGRGGSGAVVVALVALTFVTHLPAVLTVIALCVTGVGCATAMLAFDLARREDDGHDGASTSALVNLGGFSAAIAGDALVALTRSTMGTQTTLTLLPVLVIALAGLLGQTSRRYSARSASIRLASAPSSSRA